MSKTSKIISQAFAESRKALLENDAKAICTDYNIPVTKFILAKTCKESVEAAQQIGATTIGLTGFQGGQLKDYSSNKIGIFTVSGNRSTALCRSPVCRTGG